MKCSTIISTAAVFLGLCLLLGAGSFALAQEHWGLQFQGNLNGYNEVPSVITTGSAQVTVAVASNQESLTVTLNFKLPSSDTLQSAALYLGQPGTTGGLVAYICGGGSQPACPATSPVTATIANTTADVPGIPAQGLAAGDLASVIQATEKGAVYVNVYTSQFPAPTTGTTGGEMRGQLTPGFGFGGAL